MIVEDGTGLANADALISVAYADAYHAARGNAWAGTTQEKEAAIIRATDYLRTMAWAGSPLNDVQALPWPRADIGIPEAIKMACAEYALRARASALDEDEPAQSEAQSKTIRLGPMQTTISVGGGRRGMERRAYPAADRLIARYLAQATREVIV